MKRPQKHYRSAEEIIRLIDANRSKLEGMPAEMADLNRYADGLVKCFINLPEARTDGQKATNYWIHDQVKKYREEAEMLERSIPRLQRKADLLKQKLSAFQTIPMKGIVGEDESVV